MVLATSSKPDQLLLLTYAGHVSLEDLTRASKNIRALLAELSPGLRVLADYTNLEKLDPEGLPEIGRVMEAVDKIGVGAVVRVIPRPDRDPGINIMTRFHYRHPPKIITCETLADAFKALSL